MKDFKWIQALSVLTLLGFSLVTVSCDDGDKMPSNAVFIFGHFYGECLGESCVETFKLESGKLYEDRTDSYGHISFDFDELSTEDFLLVKDLNTKFPEQLWSEIETVLGCPDCADGGGIYIQYSRGDLSGAWRMQTGFSEESEYAYLNNFIDEVMKAIRLLNE